MGWGGGSVSRGTDIGQGRAIGGDEGAWGITPDAEPILDGEVRCEVGKRRYGNRNSFFILGFLCLLAAKEGHLAFCGGLREISTIRLFVVGHSAISVLLGFLFGFLPRRVGNVTSVGLVTVWFSFPEFVVGGLAWRGRWGEMVRMCGSGRRAEVYGMIRASIHSLAFRTRLGLIG